MGFFFDSQEILTLSLPLQNRIAVYEVKVTYRIHRLEYVTFLIFIVLFCNQIVNYSQKKRASALYFVQKRTDAVF